jgi:triphosphoribosyl-dephospho-CoA synthetase
VRPVGHLQALDDAVDQVGRLQQLGQGAGIAQARQHALEQALARAPDALLAQRHRQRAAVGHGVLHPLERADVLASV